MTGSGNYVIIAPSQRGVWRAYSEGKNKWGPLEGAWRFETYDEAKGHLKEAERDAIMGDYPIKHTAMLIIRAEMRLVVQRGFVVLKGGEQITIDFQDKSLFARQMRDLGLV